jgi:putative toxin-antitoxin system antitoxin component (TIGR02293 family)
MTAAQKREAARRQDPKPASLSIKSGLSPSRKGVSRKTSSLFVRMGELVGKRMSSQADVLTVVLSGLPAKGVYRFADAYGIDPSIVAPSSTLRRRATKDEALTVDESERLMRIVRVTSLAESLYEDDDRAKQWLATAAAFVPGREPISPLELAATESGARIVEEVIQRVAHGMP